MSAEPPAPLAASFALAKIQPPRLRAGLVERPGLERALGAALAEQRLVLLLAPAGYGKTAALTRQLRALPAGCALAWVSADEDDSLPRFLACLGAALEPHDLPWRVAPEALATLATSHETRGLRRAAAEIVNALAAAEVEHGLIVVDDAHRIADAQVFELLALMLERLPERWTLVVASRVEPPLPLARLRAAGELAEFRRADLRFGEAEVAALLAATPAAVPRSATARDLLDRTDGWAAGLRLTLAARAAVQPAAGAVHASALPASAQRHLFDYLAAEVLDDMPRALRDFLLDCALLPELNAKRCAHVSGRADALQLLDQIERRGLFASVLDAEELTLRLHDLFRDFLEDRLQRERPGDVPGLLRRAAEDEPDLSRAVGWLARAAAWDEATRLLAVRGPRLISAGQVQTLERLLALFPPAQAATRPDLHLLRAFAAFTRFDFDAVVDAAERAADGYRRAGREDAAATAEAYALLGMQSTGRLQDSVAGLARLLADRPLPPAARALAEFASAWGAYADLRPRDAAPHFAAMIDALERVPDADAWDPCFFHSLLVGLPGLAPLARRFAERALRLTGEAPSQLRAGVLHARVVLALEAGRLDEAARGLARADEDCRWLGGPRHVLTESHMAHVLVDALCGNAAASAAAAEACLHDLATGSSASNRLTHGYEVIFTHLRASWILGDAAALRRCAALLAGCRNDHEWPAAAQQRRFAEAFVALLDGRLEAARERLEALVAASDETSCFFPIAQAHVLLADVQLRLGRAAAAAAALAPWLDAARRGERLGGALLAGPGVLARLAAHDWGGRLDDGDRALLRGLAGQLEGVHRGSPPRGARGAEQAPAAAGRDAALLTEREREVLARIAAGDSNKVIARAFELSPHTVKRHVANILGKLGVETRGQAAARWRDGGAQRRSG